MATRGSSVGYTAAKAMRCCASANAARLKMSPRTTSAGGLDGFCASLPARTTRGRGLRQPSVRYLRLLGRWRLGGRRRGRRGCGGRGAVAPAYERARLAGVLVEDDEVEEEVALHVLLAHRVFRDALSLGPIGDVLVEQLLGVVGGPFLAIIVHRVGEPLALGGSRGRCGAGHGGTGEHRARCPSDHEPLPR